ncbi:MAG: CapA family protein [Verrucomicrobiales bacterium]|nr:CapA family protein [Verrucomicrobiales bacterium]
MATIVVGADICPIERCRALFEAGDAKALFNDLLPDLRQADFSIVNLECPLVEKPTAIRKTGPTFGESPRCLNGLKAAGIKAVGLANNHIMDHGSEGLASTLEACRREGILTVGAGPNLDAAAQPLYHQTGDLRIAALAIAEREFSIAGETRPGANPIDPIALVRTFEEIRRNADFVVVLYHGSDEFFVPTPQVRKNCRFLVELGAHAVFVQHPHVVGGIERYRGGFISYGQGALVMDEAIYRARSSFHEGYLVRIRVSKGTQAAIDLIPFEQSVGSPGARRLPPQREAAFLASLDQRSKQLEEPGFLAREWLRFCRENQHGYMSALLGHGRILSRLNRSGWVTRHLYRRICLLRARNIALCETHREAIQTLFDEGVQP